jgi:HEAT repeat protein
VAGFLVGRVFPGAGFTTGGHGPDPTPEGAPTITNIDFRDSDPLSDRVSLTYDTLRRTSLSGTAGDPRIRRVLVDTVRDSGNAGLRLEALDVLRRHVDDREVRQALLRAVREDENAGARLKALEALKERAADDPEVRGAIVQALLKDTNPGVRVRAIDALKGTRGPETLAVLKRLADEDPSEYVRLRSAAWVSEMIPQEGVR